MPDKEKRNKGEQKKSGCGCGCIGTTGIGAKKEKAAADKTKK